MTIRQDLIIEQNADWTFSYVHKDSDGSAIDLTGYSAAMSIKKVPGQVTVARAYLSTGSDADGGTITLSGADGTVTLSMTAAQTLKLVWEFDLWALLQSHDMDDVFVQPQVNLLYDINLTDAGGKTARVLEGKVIVRRSVTP